MSRVHPRRDHRGVVWEFITWLRTAWYLNLRIVCFWNFPCVVFRRQLITGNWNCGKWNSGWGRTIDLAHVMGAETSHYLPSVSWKPRKACQCIFWRRESWRADGLEYSTLNLRAWEPGASPQAVRQSSSNSPCRCYLLLVPSTDWVMPTHTGKGHLLSSVC